VIKRFLGVLIASMFLASVAYAASDMKKEEGKAAKDGTAVESTTKGEKGEKTKGEKSAKTPDEKAVKSKGEKDEKIRAKRPQTRRRRSKALSIKEGGPPHLPSHRCHQPSMASHKSLLSAVSTLPPVRAINLLHSFHL
jgi:hypothetical protein